MQGGNWTAEAHRVMRVIKAQEAGAGRPQNVVVTQISEIEQALAAAAGDDVEYRKGLIQAMRDAPAAHRRRGRTDNVLALFDEEGQFVAKDLTTLAEKLEKRKPTVREYLTSAHCLLKSAIEARFTKATPESEEAQRLAAALGVFGEGKKAAPKR